VVGTGSGSYSITNFVLEVSNLRVLLSDFDSASIQVNPYYLWAATDFINFPVIDLSHLQAVSSCEPHTIQIIGIRLSRYYANICALVNQA
jgi:hypothetical protein